jgi:hypothetical protein
MSSPAAFAACAGAFPSSRALANVGGVPPLVRGSGLLVRAMMLGCLAEALPELLNRGKRGVGEGLTTTTSSLMSKIALLSL